MNKLLATALVILVFVVIVLAMGLLLTFGFAGIGWIVHRAFGLELLPATAMAVVLGIGIGVILHKVIATPNLFEDGEDDEWNAWDEGWDDECRQAMAEPWDEAWDEEYEEEDEDEGDQGDGR